MTTLDPRDRRPTGLVGPVGEYAAILAFVAVTLAIVILAGVVVVVLFGPPGAAVGPLITMTPAHLHPFFAAGATMMFLNLGLLLFALGRTRQVMSAYRRGEILSARSGRRVVAIGGALIALALLIIAGKVAAYFVIRDMLGAARTPLPIAEAFILLFGLLVVATGRGISEAARTRSAHAFA